jgi:hypothetical protein
MDNESYYTIATTSCDVCDRKGPVSLYHHRGTPVLASCSMCDPKAWERAGEEARTAWLEGRSVEMGEAWS